MEQVTKPKVRLIASGEKLTVKEMQAKAGDLLPKHLASVESILFVHQGECVLYINDEEKVLRQGDGFVIPPETKHQIKAITDFRGIHFMPSSIKFEYFS